MQLKASATVNLPLHDGHAPVYLIRRMIALSYAISKIIVDEYGKHEFLRRLADPLWFQAFGCVLGFDWHSSGVTTVVTGVLKQSLKEDVHGISIAEGKGSKSTATKNDISAKLIIYYIQYNNNDRNVQSRNCQISYARYIHRKTCYS